MSKGQEELIRAAQRVYDDLNARIDAAVERGEPIPVFDGIADLHDALRQQAPAEQEPVAWLIDWPDEPELGHYFGEEPNEHARSRPLYAAPIAAEPAPAQDEREAPVVVATAILGGLFHGGSGPELGEIDIEVCMPELEAIQCETVNGSDDVFLPLMTVAQHERIVAALARPAQAAPQPERIVTAAYLRTDVIEALNDAEWAMQNDPSCQHGVVSRCKCQGCVMDRMFALRAALAKHGEASR